MSEPCNCIAELDAALADRNTKISPTIRFRHDPDEASLLPTILTEKVDSKKRGQPTLVLPTFCPFCGVRFVKERAPMPAEGWLA